MKTPKINLNLFKKRQNTMNQKEKLQKELGELKEKVNALEKSIDDLDKPKTVLNATNAKEALEAAINYLGESDEEVIIYRQMEKGGMPSHYLSEQRCILVCRALNEKKPLNSTTYTPWFDKNKKPGAGFFYSSITWSRGSVTDVCFRLHLNNRKHAIHAGTVMDTEYYNYIMINK